MGDGHFFSVQLLSAVAEAPRPFGFLVSGAQGQGLFLLLLLRRHRAAVAHGDSVLIVVFAHHAPVFELDVDGFAEVSNYRRSFAEVSYLLKIHYRVQRQG